MKYFFTAACLFLTLMAKAQIVNIPDSNFKAALIARGVDLNNDGEIQQSEANIVTEIQLNYSTDTVKDITGIRSFTNLEKFICSWEIQLANVDVSGLVHLQQIQLPTKIINLNVSNCINLAELDFGAMNYSLKIINAENCSRLKTINLSYLAVSDWFNVNLMNCDSLTTIIPGMSSIWELNISQCDRIVSLNNLHNVGKLIARNCLSLKEVTCTPGGSFVNVEVAGCINLEILSVGEGGQIGDIDLSSCPNFKKLGIYGPTCIDKCLNINLKNGTQISECNIYLSGYVSANGFPQCINFCTDDFEVASSASWLKFIDPPGPPNTIPIISPIVNINTYCTFNPAAAYNSINGKASIAQNNICDSTSRGIYNIPILISDTIGNRILKITEVTGIYNHYFYKGIYSVTPYFPYPYFNINPASATVAFDTANSLTATRDFCIQPNGIHNDLEISFLPSWPPARPGFDAAYTLLYKNRGTTTLSGNVQVNFDNGKMNFVNASSPVTTQSTGQLIWNYNNLQPFESKTIQVTFNLLPPTVNNIGDTINFLAAITPNTADETPYDNSFILPQRIIGSYDPNDKQCLEGSKLNISKIGDYLHYQIRFQNEGTDTAFNIVVADTLSNKYDWNSFEYLGSSHTADVKLTNNKLEFIFQNIKLPHKAINEPASHGWVAFKIKPKASVVVGDSLNNKAAIYFDFNFPIITNTATTVVTNTSAPVPVKLEYFSVANNNNGHLLQWKAACSNGNANFSIESSTDGIHFNSIGNINTTALRCQLPLSFTNNNPQVGKTFYRLKITDADGVVFYSKILVVGNTKAGIEISAVANNTVYLNSSKQQTIQLKVMAADGKQILAQQQTVLAGSNNFSLQMKHAAKGIYTLILCNQEGEIITKRFLK